MLHFRIPAAAVAALGITLGTAFGTGALTPAAADRAQDRADGVQLAQAESYSDEKLETFALAALEIQEIRSQYTAQIQQAESEDQRQQLAESAQDEMVGAIQAIPGITIEEYNAIIQASADDPELSERISQHMQAATQ